MGERTIRFTAWALIAFGAIVRLRQYLGARSMSYDEARVATEIASRTLVQMVQPAGFIRVAPPGWFFLEKLSIMAFGTGELSLRLVPLLASLIALPLFWLVPRRYLGAGAAVICLAFASMSEQVIWYSSVVKQYSSDVTWCLLILLAVQPLFESTPARRSWIIAATVGAIAPWFAHPALFLLPAAGLTILATALVRDRRRLEPVLALGGAWVASLALNWVLVLRVQAGRDDLINYWRTGFPPHGGFPMAQLHWLLDHAHGYLDMPAGLHSFSLVAFAVLVGILAVTRRHRPLAAMIALIFGGTLAASALRLYPFQTRLLLFTVPPFLLVLAAGVLELDGVGRARWLRPGLLLLALIAAPSLLHAGRMIVKPEGREEIKDVVNYAAARMNADDGMYLGRSAFGAYTWYTGWTNALHNPRDRTTVGSDVNVGIDSTRAEIERLRRYHRVWMVFVDYWPADMKIVLDQIEPLAERRDEFMAPGAAAYLYEFRSPPDSVTALR
jgi:uncharacterized membrane protein